jgi:hypothetical protein
MTREKQSVGYRLDIGPCENFLYVFKAARRAARAANTARTPPLPLALPLRRRQRRSAGAKMANLRAAIDVQQSPVISRGEVVSMLPLPVLSGPGRTCQERLRRRLRRSSTLDRTCPAVGVGSYREHGHEWPGRLTLNPGAGWPCGDLGVQDGRCRPVKVVGQQRWLWQAKYASSPIDEGSPHGPGICDS